MVAVDTRPVSVAQDTYVVSGIHVMQDCVPAAMPMLAAAPQAASEVAQTRPRGDCSVNLLMPVDGSIEPLDDDAPDVLSSEREPAGGSSEVGRDVCVVPDLLPTAVSVRTVVAEMWMERFVLVPEACPVVSMTSTVARTFGPALSEENSPVVLAGGGGRLLRHTPWSWLSQIQHNCLSCQSPVVSSLQLFWGRSPWMWSIWVLARRVSDWIRRKPCRL